MRVAAVALTPERTLADLQRQYADRGGVVAMFSVRAGQTQVLHEGIRPPQHGVTLVALVPGEVLSQVPPTA